MGEVCSFFFFSELGPFFKKAPHLTDLNCRLVHTLMSVKMPPSSKTDVDRQTHRQTDYDYYNHLVHARRGLIIHKYR